MQPLYVHTGLGTWLVFTLYKWRYDKASSVVLAMNIYHVSDFRSTVFQSLFIL
jgi:hypothetical protein